MSQWALARKIAIGAVRVGRRAGAARGPRRWMRRQPRRHHFACETIGPGTRVRNAHALREHIGFPSGRRDLVPLKLLHNLKRTVHSVQPAARKHMLPLIQKALELRRYGLDFATELSERQPMNARQNATIAPFDRIAGRSEWNVCASPGLRIRAEEGRFD